MSDVVIELCSITFGSSYCKLDNFKINSRYIIA